MNGGTGGIPSGLDVTFAGIKFRSPIGVAAMGVPLGKGETPEDRADILLKYPGFLTGDSQPGTLHG